ncbi:conserved hypothetical protein [methanotrophic bacterial endosymbiont of Bathymodiolus sp.]|nr:conserved hypothetical protein [methanotrophic bacterial endosymbiont of Bathymodiolus sp.]
MGVFPSLDERYIDSRSLPHARGGVSAEDGYPDTSSVSSPRPWGCFNIKRNLQERRKVFPTPVGVFLEIK